MVSFIIVNWNSRAYLRKCLHSLYTAKQSRDWEFVVVDGASYDGCEEMLANEFKDVTFIQSKVNVGFGACNNIAVRQAKGDILILINPDCEIELNAISFLIETLANDKAIGLVGPRLLNSDGSVQRSCVQASPTWLNQLLDFEVLRRLLPRLKIWKNYQALNSPLPTEVEAISGACMAIRKRDFEFINGFSENYFMYGEDLDLCARIRKAGLKVVHCPMSRVVHHGGGSSGGSFSKLSAIMMKNSVYRYIKDHQGYLSANVYRTCMAISAVIRLLAISPIYFICSARFKVKLANVLKKWLSIFIWCFRGVEFPKRT